MPPSISPGFRPAPGGLNDGPNQPAQPYPPAQQPIPRPGPGGIYGSPDQPPSRWPGPGVRPLPQSYQPPIRGY
jgi:hypothetical protein